MNPHTILRRLTTLVGAALAGLRVRQLIREARLGCSHVHDRDAAAGAVPLHDAGGHHPQRERGLRRPRPPAPRPAPSG